MSIVRNNSHPLITPDDKVLLAFDQYETKAKLYIRALKAGTEVVLRSGADQATAQAKVAADATSGVMVYDQIEVMDLPATGTATDRVTEIRCVSGQAAIEIVSPSGIRSFLQQLTPTIT